MSVDQRLRVEVRPGDGRVVLELHGELDLASSAELAEAIARAQAQAGEDPVVLDLEDLQFLDSAGLRVILGAHDRARQVGRELAITPGTPQVQRLLKVAGVSRLLPTVGSADGALAADTHPDGQA